MTTVVSEPVSLTTVVMRLITNTYAYKHINMQNGKQDEGSNKGNNTDRKKETWSEKKQEMIKGTL